MDDPSGVAALQNAVSSSTDSSLVVFGYSEGATVVEKWLRQQLADPNPPSPATVKIVVIGNPTRPNYGIAVPNGVVWPQSNYQVIDVARQYDGVADFPNNTASRYYWLAVRNATVGTLFGGLHNYAGVNLYDPANAVWTSEDGNTTYVLVPTENVPLLGGLAPMFPGWNAKLKAEIETAYIRPVPFPTTTPPASPAASPASPPSSSAVADSTVAAQLSTVPLTVTMPAASRTVEAAATAAEPSKVGSLDTVPAADDITTNPPSSEGNADAKWRTITTPGAEPQPDTAGAATPSTPETHTSSASSSPDGKQGATYDTSGTGSVTAQGKDDSGATAKSYGDTSSHRKPGKLARPVRGTAAHASVSAN